MHFDPTPAARLNYQNTLAPGIVICIMRRRRNHFNWKHWPATRLRPPMHASTIFIQRPQSQAPLPAKSLPKQSTRFKLRNQRLGLSTTTPPPHHSRFAHNSSPPLNLAAQQSALLRRIRCSRFSLPTPKTCHPERSVFQRSRRTCFCLCLCFCLCCCSRFSLPTPKTCHPERSVFQRSRRTCFCP